MIKSTMMSDITMSDITSNMFTKNKQTEDSILDDVSVLDEKWVKQAYMIGNDKLENKYKKFRYWSRVETKFVDTSLGGHLAINPLPQFTEYCDIRSKGLIEDRDEVTVNNLKGNFGMGRYYGEVIDDNYTLAYFTFGKPEFTSLFTYVLQAVDYKQSIIANTGRSTVLYTAGEIWGNIALAAAFGPLGIGVILVRYILGEVLKVLGGPGLAKYYYMKPDMTNYWATVNSLVTLMATELGIVVPMFMKNKKDPEKVGLPVKLDQSDLDFIKQYMPDIITGDNYIDVFSMVTRAQRAYFNRLEKENSDYKPKDVDEYLEAIKEAYKEETMKPKYSDVYKKVRSSLFQQGGLYGKLDTTMTNNVPDDSDTTKSSTESAISKEHEAYDKEGRLVNNRKEDEPSAVKKWWDQVEAVVKGGAHFMILRIDHPGQSTERFSNNVSNINLEDTLNSVSRKTRSLEFDFAGGVIPGMDKVIGGLKDLAMGALDSITVGLSNVANVLLGGANLEMPLRWESSNAYIPELHLRTRLVSPYGNPISQLINIYIPLAAIMAGALPLATGPTSHTSPHLCSLFIRGYQHIELGLITSLSITRGVSNLPFNKSRRSLAFDVSITVRDLSKIISMPVVRNLGDAAFVSYNASSPLNRYIASLCARDIFTTESITAKWKINASRWIQNNIDRNLSPSTWAMRTGELVPEIVKDFMFARYFSYSENN